VVRSESRRTTVVGDGKLINEALRTPRPAAYAGILFAVLLGISMVLI
jgi:hypothetical protein